MPDEIKDIEPMFFDVIDQPIEGLLYDLNLLPEQLLEDKDARAWTTMKVIIALKHKLEEARNG